MRTLTVSLLLVFMFGACAYGSKVQFEEMSGSDLGMGVGARAIGMGGAFTALADDATAMFWNPAGMARMKKSEVMMMTDRDPIRYTYKAIVLKPRNDWERSNLAFGVARTNRLKYVGRGDWNNDPYAKHLIDLSMIAVDFTDDDPDTGWQDTDGGINSRTNDWRASIAWTFPSGDLAVGVTYVDFKCVTTFFGDWNGRVCQIVAYNTWDAGLLYRRDESRMQYGLMLKNALEETKPKYATLAAAYFKNEKDVYTLDFERIFGNYSGHLRQARFFFIRAGMERAVSEQWKLRFGLVVPLQAKTSTLGNILKNIPSPKFGGAIGMGYSYQDTDIDFALYGDPGKSYVEHDAKLNFTVTARQKF
ncbi:MAG: UPF0164 family protein [bacterium]